MRVNQGIRDNLRLLIAEVGSQVEGLHGYIERDAPELAQRILDRGGYAHNLKLRIHDSCVQQLLGAREAEPRTLSLRAMELVATDLERIAELCREAVGQVSSMPRRRYLDPEAYGPLLARIVGGIGMIQPAIAANDTRLALKLGDIEARLDRAYGRLLRGYIAALKGRKHTEELIAALFLAHAVEQMGDALLRISEAIISANLGQPVNIDRYASLQASVARLAGGEGEGLRIEAIAETRSGSAVSGISSGSGRAGDYVAIYKDGERRKLKEERQGVRSWHQLYPGLAPRILSYQKRGRSAALLIEHLAGLTFEQILLHGPPEVLEEALEQLGRTLRSVWRETRTKKRVAAGFMRQAARRLPEVYAIHPEFARGESRICGLEVPSFDRLVARARDYEKGLRAPFSVYIHGDFNVDNIIYDPLEGRINFIDLHRSRYMDYVQDVSVFMVSNYRLQILDAPLRRRIMGLAQAFYGQARRYARRAGDETFELRLALGLARSFATSTRFILDKSLARSMFLRARYLIEQVLAVDPRRAAGYRLPIKEIFSG